MPQQTIVKRGVPPVSDVDSPIYIGQPADKQLSDKCNSLYRAITHL